MLLFWNVSFTMWREIILCREFLSDVVLLVCPAFKWGFILMLPLSNSVRTCCEKPPVVQSFPVNVAWGAHVHAMCDWGTNCVVQWWYNNSILPKRKEKEEPKPPIVPS